VSYQKSAIRNQLSEISYQPLNITYYALRFTFHVSHPMIFHLNTPQATQFLEVAEEAARSAGAVALEGFRGVMQVRSKGGKDIVTEYDTAAEEAALRVIGTRFPDHAIIAEESGASGLSHVAGARWVWTIDPIDGTHNYAMQLPFWCTAVAVADATTGEVEVGVVFDALHDELFGATRGGGAYLNGKPMRISQKSRLEDAMLACDIGYEPEVAARMMALAARVQPHVKRLRLLGSAVLAMAYVAAGRFDAYYHLSLQPWDIAAASLLVREAGGVITDWDGMPIRATRTSAVAAAVDLQPRLLALLNE
jgi:myo-inositol-1(or 4)-monophosphatase